MKFRANNKFSQQSFRIVKSTIRSLANPQIAIFIFFRFLTMDLAEGSFDISHLDTATGHLRRRNYVELLVFVISLMEIN